MPDAQQPNPTLDAILNEADRIEEDTLFSAKGQWETGRELGWLHLAIGIPATISAAVAGVSAVSECKSLTVTLTVLTAILAGLLTFLDPKARANTHRRAGNAYKALSNDARIFKQVTCGDITALAQLKKTLDKLNRRRNALNSKSPAPSRWAFQRARQGIESGEATYRTDTPNRKPGEP